MTTESDRHQPPSLNDLLGEALRHAAELVRSEIALLRAEVSATMRRLAFGLVLMVLAAVFGVIAIGLVVEALVAWLTPIIGSGAAAAILCAAATGAVSAGLFIAGYRRLRAQALFPDRAAASIKDDVRLIQRRAA